MSKTVTFGVQVEYANPNMPVRVHGIEMFVAKVVEFWPNGEGKTVRKVVKKFQFYSAGKANQEADTYVAKNYDIVRETK